MPLVCPVTKTNETGLCVIAVVYKNGTGLMKSSCGQVLLGVTS